MWNSVGSFYCPVPCNGSAVQSAVPWCAAARVSAQSVSAGPCQTRHSERELTCSYIEA